MAAKVIDGKALAEKIRGEIKASVENIVASHKDAKPPGLAVIICGTRKDSQTYVRLKGKAAVECGFKSFQIELPEDVTQETLESKIAELNNDPECHAMLVQLPLPKHLNEARALELIDPKKDADGLHSVNVGLLNLKGKTPYFYPCTPVGVIEMLKRSDIPMSGKHAVVVGRSNIVGQPVAQLLLQNDATVTIIHSRTPNPEHFIRQADIVVAACGRAELIKGSWIKPGAAVLDVGTNPVDDSTKQSGYRLVGDVEYAEAAKTAGHISPVPGGVGPMTIAMLLSNTLRAYKRSMGLEETDAVSTKVELCSPQP